MKAMRLICFGLLLCSGLVLALSCGKDDGDETPVPNSSLDDLDCSASGNDEKSCDYAACNAKSEKAERLSDCADGGETACDAIEDCYDDYASCHLGKCPAGGKLADADPAAVQACVATLNACLVGGDPTNPIDVIDCEGEGQKSELCNYEACLMVGVAKEDKHDCEVADADFCEDFYQCYVDYVGCYNVACPPGVDKADSSMSETVKCNSALDDCVADYEF